MSEKFLIGKVFEDGNLLPSLNNICIDKKPYNKCLPYEVMLRSLLIHTYGLVDNNLNFGRYGQDEGLYKIKPIGISS